MPDCAERARPHESPSTHDEGIVIDAAGAFPYHPVSVPVTPRMYRIRPRPEIEWPRMFEPFSRFASLPGALARFRFPRPVRDRPPSLGRVLEAALFLRLLAAVGVEWYVQRTKAPRVCIFPDAEYYWGLAGTIVEGTPYEIVE